MYRLIKKYHSNETKSTIYCLYIYKKHSDDKFSKLLVLALLSDGIIEKKSLRFEKIGNRELKI